MNCACTGSEHIVCRPDIPHPKLRDPWRELAPWLATYPRELPPDARQLWAKAYAARRKAATKLGVILKAPVVVAAVHTVPGPQRVLSCSCQGRVHLVCLPPRKWNALVKVNGAYDRRPVDCQPCRRDGHYNRLKSNGKRQKHAHVCRVLHLAERYRYTDRPSIHRRVLRLWLAELRTSWARPSAERGGT